MIDNADLIYAGNSSALPARTFVIRAGTSIVENRDYIIYYSLRAIHLTSVVEVSSGLAAFGRLYIASLQASAVLVGSGSANLSRFTAYSFTGEVSVVNVQGGPLSIYFYRLHDTSQIIVASGLGNLIYTRQFTLATSAVEVRSSTVTLASVPLNSAQLETSIVQVLSNPSVLIEYSVLGVGVVSVASSTLRTEYQRIINLDTLSLGVSSSEVSASFFTGTVFPVETSVINVSSSILTTSISAYLSGISSIITVASTPVQLVYDRIWNIETLALGVASGLETLIFNTLRTSSVEVSSNNAVLGLQYFATLQTSSIQVRSSDAVFKNPFLVGLSSVIQVVSPFGDLRKLATGYLPGFRPTNRSFEPPQYSIIRTPVMTGGTHRNMMCSKATNAMLRLEYANVPDNVAGEVVQRYEESFGFRYGFTLPDEVMIGAEPELINYIKLSGSQLKWFYAEKPVVESISKGLSRLTVDLKARLEVV